MAKLRYLGLDVHAASITVAVAEPGGEVRSVGQIPNRPDAVRRLVNRLGPAAQLRACYEAGPTGYVLYWQLTQLGVHCDVVAPTLVVWVPDAAHEALRDLVRAREAGKQDQLRARHRLAKFLLRHGRRPPPGVKAWTAKYLTWVQRAVRFEQVAQEAVLLDYLHEVEHAAARLERLERAIDQAVEAAPAAMRAVIEALQALRGIAQLSAVTIVAEVGALSRFATPRQLTKTGNAHLRRIVVEAAWAYRYRPAVGYTLKRRQQGVSPQVREIAWKAQHRLHARYRKLLGRGKRAQQVVTALARELLGFVWAIGVQVEQEWRAARAA
jgi:transposase